MGEGIQGDVHLAIGGPGAGLGTGVDEVEALGGHAVLGEAGLEQGLEGRLAEGLGVEHQPGGGNLAQDAGPSGDHPGVDAFGAAEVAEGDVALGQGRRGGRLGHPLRRRIGERDAWQANDLAFREQMVRAFGRQLGVGDEGVDGGKARGVAVAEEVGDLHRRGLAGEDPQAAPGSVAAEVQQDVDPVADDQGGHGLVRQTGGGTPLVGQGLEPLRDRVGAVEFSVAEDLEGVVIEAG